MSDDHDHNHDHARTVKPMVDEITDFEVLEIALRELCIEKGIFTAEEHRRFTEFAEQIGPTPAARLVARAWLDPEFKHLALTDALAASASVSASCLKSGSSQARATRRAAGVGPICSANSVNRRCSSAVKMPFSMLSSRRAISSTSKSVISSTMGLTVRAWS